MTAIIAYINKKGDDTIGVLSSDDLEGWSKCNVDKLTKLSNRFVIAITGLEVVDWAISTCIAYFDQFSGSSSKIKSIEELGHKLEEIFPVIFKRWKETNFYDNIDKQIEIRSLLIVLDLSTNKLYYSDIGKVWKIENLKKYQIKFKSLEYGLYSFGVVVEKNDFKKEAYNEFDKDAILFYLKNRFMQFKSENPNSVGNLGSVELNILGTNPYESFTSSFATYLDYANNIIKRSKK